MTSDELQAVLDRSIESAGLDWGPREHAAFLSVEPDKMYTFARYPERFPG